MGGMKYGTRIEGAASLKLAIPTALPDHMRGQVIEVRSLRTEPTERNKGAASDLMLSVCLEADMARKFLFLCVEPDIDSPVDETGLVNFYMRFGFMPIQAKPILMTRPFAGAMGAGNV
jgi:hypothetical protein